MPLDDKFVDVPPMECEGVMTTETSILFWAIALGIFQMLLSVSFNVVGRGLPYGVGPRDEPPKQLGRAASRIERAYHNFLETFALFAAAVLLVQAFGKSTTLSVLGAEFYIWARLFYVPAYVIAIPYTRTACWMVSIVGIVMVLSAAWPR
jgi:uncharacterized MAPEG superfamily protein